MHDTETDTAEEGQTGLFKLDVHPWVFFSSAAIIVLFVGLTIFFESTVDNLFNVVQGAVSTYAGWFFVGTMNLILIYVISLLFGRFGDIRLGGEGAKPEFSTLGWFAMLFSAGMGIGLLFYGVAEPMFHYVASPLAEPGTPAAARVAMDFTFLHWGLHPWSIYALVGLALGFFAFNKGLPLSIRSVFYPLLGERIYGPIGNVIDIMATVATMFGVATSLGLGVQQVNAGLSHLLDFIPQNASVQLALIAGITMIATWSVVRGLDSGIKFLSQLNVVVAAALMLFVLLLGPTLFILNAFIENLGVYVQNFPSLSTWNETYNDTDWQNGWTVFYWGWWIAWSPFVGMFIARVSYGRTIREFIKGVLLVPTLVTFLWVTVFGDTALHIEMFGDGGLAKAVQENIPVSLFVMLESLPLSEISSVVAIIVIITFFVTSSDSGSLVIDIITAGGNTEPPVIQRVFWALLEGAVAAALLLGGGLVALQTAAISTGLPFAIILIGMCWSLHLGLVHYKTGQGFELGVQGYEGPEFKTHATRKMPTFGRRQFWLTESLQRRTGAAMRPRPTPSPAFQIEGASIRSESSKSTEPPTGGKT
ncbi:choline/carnitine/betaine transporter [Thiorhodococcus drewsii AZ1]|uniref:Choline/carnitine/betaine transporter n=1 Tax=Thiorhodococcus drewsii AZ1 TaxID=765913 RepID=G2E2B1_9GAMM|nr:BCCT family transporter [Thiorhodococcus drewsii]EGV30827.1 choline/carnitine/betaine transporter [Thiorhodococcus drewsii AZ1]